MSLFTRPSIIRHALRGPGSPAPRAAFISAAANGVTVLASSGDFGTANPGKTPIKHPRTIPFPTVNWPASDPLVTGVGGTYLCTDPTGNNQTDPTVPGYPVTTGWDPITGLGTPNAATLVPALAGH
jgi:subtilase family serine protease